MWLMIKKLISIDHALHWAKSICMYQWCVCCCLLGQWSFPIGSLVMVTWVRNIQLHWTRNGNISMANKIIKSLIICVVCHSIRFYFCSRIGCLELYPNRCSVWERVRVDECEAQILFCHLCYAYVTKPTSDQPLNEINSLIDQMVCKQNHVNTCYSLFTIWLLQ